MKTLIFLFALNLPGRKNAFKKMLLAASIIVVSTFLGGAMAGAQVIAGGGSHSLAVCSDGTARSWGWDYYGQLGDDAALTDQSVPTAIASLTGLTAISGGGYHSLALKNDGTVWSCGSDMSGQLGDDAAIVDQPTPVQVSGLTGITAIAGGGNHSLALKNDGTVWSWGSDNVGQLGDDAALSNKSTPVQVSGLTGITAIAAGLYHSFALKNDGTVWSWGRDNYGQLGDDAALVNQPVPVAVFGLTGITAIAGGEYAHSLALKNDGTVWSWGSDGTGQLGDDAALLNQPVPVVVFGLTGIISIAGGLQHSLALKNDGTVWSWGSDMSGQLGDDATLADKPTPVQVSPAWGGSITSLEAGDAHSLALKNDGTVWSWGDDFYGQLGDDAAIVNKPTPVQVSGLCPIPISLAATTSQTNVSCNGGSNGTATVTVTTGSPPYTYLWNNGQTTQTATGLSAGSYTVTVTDALSAAATKTVTITQPAALTAAQSQINVSCNGGTNGTATVVSSGGTPAYMYSWTTAPVQTLSTATGLSAGTYTCTITDANGCIITKTFTITQPAAITSTVSINNITCNGQNNGSAAVTAGGGSPGYLYSWSTTPAQTTSNATGLSAATYTVTITDASGCTKTDMVTVSQPPPIVVTLTANPANCGFSNGSADASSSSGGTGAHTYSWSNGQTTAVATGLAAGSYTVTITDANGCTMASVANVTNIGAPVVSVLSQINVSCNGGNDGSATSSVSGGIAPYTYSWNTIPVQTTVTATGLSAGSYNITVTDSVGCIGIITATITEPPILTASVSQNNVLCNGGNDGNANANAGGGTTPYTYVWNSTPVQNTATATGLAAGSYTVTVTDANGCTTTQAVTITQPAALSVAVTPTPASCSTCSDGTATATPSGGTPGYAYVWSPGGQSTQTVTGILPGTYTVCVTDANGCIMCNTVTVTFTTGINEVASSGIISIHPNPFAVQATIVFNSIIDHAEVKVVDMVGKEVQSVIINNSDRAVIRRENFQDGIYFIKIISGGNIFGTGKLIMQ